MKKGKNHCNKLTRDDSGLKKAQHIRKAIAVLKAGLNIKRICEKAMRYLFFWVMLFVTEIEVQIFFPFLILKVTLPTILSLFK